MSKIPLPENEWEHLIAGEVHEYEPNPTQILKEQAFFALKGGLPQLDALVASAKEEGTDTTVLWCLAVIAKMMEQSSDRWSFDIRILMDVIRQRCVAGTLGDKIASRQILVHETPPEFRHIITVSFPVDPGKDMERALATAGFNWNKDKHWWWAWNDDHRQAFVDAIKKECSVSKEEKFI
jgi:hypothetical protein